jgi:predicted GIY-YIG superfamily endonuclease
LLPPRGKQRKGKGGHNKETILVTVKCFKRFCLRTNSVMSEKIVDYYLALENLLIEYQQYIISGLLKENKMLRYDLNPDSYPIVAVVYVIDLGRGYFKLGSTQNLNKRMEIYNTGYIHRNKVVFWVETSDQKTIENCAKSLLLKYAIKKGKEVYFIELQEIINVIHGCTRILANITCEICQGSKLVDDLEDHFYQNHEPMMNAKTIVDIDDN